MIFIKFQKLNNFFHMLKKIAKIIKKIKTQASTPWATHKNSEKISNFMYRGTWIWKNSMYPGTWYFVFFFKSMYPWFPYFFSDCPWLYCGFKLVWNGFNWFYFIFFQIVDKKVMTISIEVTISILSCLNQSKLVWNCFNWSKTV